MGNGMIRRVDELGRVVLPAELRRELDIGERDLVEVRRQGKRPAGLPRAVRLPRLPGAALRRRRLTNAAASGILL